MASKKSHEYLSQRLLETKNNDIDTDSETDTHKESQSNDDEMDLQIAKDKEIERLALENSELRIKLAQKDLQHQRELQKLKQEIDTIKNKYARLKRQVKLNKVSEIKGK